MFSFVSPSDGMNRREWLRVGTLGLGGVTLPQLLAPQLHAESSLPRRRRAKSVILFMLLGGPSQHDTWDPKPDAPIEVRGPFKPIATRTPGLFVGELMPETAKLTHHIAVLRAVCSNDNAHSSSGYQLLTGVPHQPLNSENATPKPPNNSPCLGGLVRYLRPNVGQLPSAITIPEQNWNDGNIYWPGQDAGVLGRKHDPWLIHCDPSNAKFQIDSLAPPDDIPAARFDDRHGLLRNIDRLHVNAELYDASVRKAFDLMSSAAARQAFDLDSEAPKLRERYGKTRFAQSCLLARRLVEAGVSLVQVNWTRLPNKAGQSGWDTHAKHNETAKDVLMPIMDQAYSALLTDLRDRGLLDDTLVVWTGEFGRTPKLNANAGRDHWGHCFSAAFAGGGVRGGTIVGTSDKHGAFPLDGRVEPCDLIATVLYQIGLAPDSEVHDTQNRPFAASRGSVIQNIL
jgi:Protein of unknown function (DUF1501)